MINLVLYIIFNPMHKRQPRRSILPMTNISTADSWNKDRFYQTGFAFFYASAVSYSKITLQETCRNIQ